MDERYDPDELRGFARDLFAALGMEADKAADVAAVLVEADLMGHDTHGLQLAPAYLEELEAGRMTGAGAPEVLSERGVAAVWDGRWLPGPWLVLRALEAAAEGAERHGMAAVAVRRSHHVACLSAYLARATERGLLVLIACSDPSDASVAPFGGLTPVFTPDPVALGIPTGGDPVLIDMSAAVTTNAMAERLHAAGRRFPGLWAQDARGRPSDDPGLLFAEPPGTILPTGGADHGHKGTNLALMVEALSQGLAGYGRAEAPETWGASVLVQVWDPAAFAGREAFERETAWTAEACHESAPADADSPVRLPGQRALEAKRRALAEGLALYPGTLEALASWAARLAVPLPVPRPS